MTVNSPMSTRYWVIINVILAESGGLGGDEWKGRQVRKTGGGGWEGVKG